jgi:hypothetical protein
MKLRRQRKSRARKKAGIKLPPGLTVHLLAKGTLTFDLLLT